MPKDTKTLGNNKARACESLGFVHKKRLCQRFDTTSLFCFKTKYEWTKYRKMGKVIVCLFKVTIFGKPSVLC